MPRTAFEHARLGVLPLRHRKCVCRELEIPMNLMAAWETIRRGRETRIDLPKVEFSSNGTPQSRYFAQLAERVSMRARLSWSNGS